MTRLVRRWHGLRQGFAREDGLLGGVDALAFGALLFVAGTLMIVNAWSVLDTRMAVSAAAREAVRTIVEAPGEGLRGGEDLTVRQNLDRLEATAQTRAEEAMIQHGKDVVERPLTLVFDPLPDDLRCASVVVHVTYAAPTIALPFIGVFRDGIDVTVNHQARIDPFRAGVIGEVRCD